jgi:uncharacterized protein (TIGR00730 family)
MIACSIFSLLRLSNIFTFGKYVQNSKFPIILLKVKKNPSLCYKMIINMPIHSLAVFCGSKNGNNALFVEHANELGKIFAEHGVTLIYGGGSVGIMGAIADAVMKNGGRVVGVIPQVLVDWERQHNSLSELLVVDNMHTRKKKMYELCDAGVILPGGFGTLDELFEMVTWNQLSIHDKFIFIINSGGFYNHLIAHIGQMQDENFLYEEARKRIIIIHSPAEILPYLDQNESLSA